MIRLIIAAPEIGSTSPASKIGVAPKSIPVSLHRLADSDANAARMSGGASAGPLINEEFPSQGMPIKARFIFCLTLDAVLQRRDWRRLVRVTLVQVIFQLQMRHAVGQPFRRWFAHQVMIEEFAHPHRVILLVGGDAQPVVFA